MGAREGCDEHTLRGEEEERVKPADPVEEPVNKEDAGAEDGKEEQEDDAEVPEKKLTRKQRGGLQTARDDLPARTRKHSKAQSQKVKHSKAQSQKVKHAIFSTNAEILDACIHAPLR